MTEIHCRLHFHETPNGIQRERERERELKKCNEKQRNGKGDTL